MFGAGISDNVASMSGFTGQADIACSTKKGLGRGRGFFFCHTFLAWRLRPHTGLSSGLLPLLMCYSSGNMETTQRLGIGNATDHRLYKRMANGEYNMNVFLLTD